MDVTNIAPRKVFRAKKTLRVSDRQQWETLLRRRHHSENEQHFKACDHQENHLQGMDAEGIDGDKSDEHFILKRANIDLPKFELNQSATFHHKNEVIKAKFKKSADICTTEKHLENACLEGQEDIQSNGHLETKKQCAQKKEYQSISLVRKVINSPSKTADQNITATNGSAIHISSYVLKEKVFDRASKPYSTKVPEQLDQKNCVKSISLDKKWDVAPVLSIIGVEDLKFVSSDPNNKTSNLKKIKNSIVPILEKMSNEAHDNMMYNVQLSALHVTQNVNDKVEEKVQNGSQNFSVLKYLNEEKSQTDESRFLTDDQEEIECSTILLKEMKSSDQVLRKRIHSRSEEKNKRVKTSEDDKIDHLNLSSKNQSAETTRKISLEEIQKMLHRKMVTEFSSDILGNKLEELAKRIENIDCRQRHEELAKSIQTRIKRLERKVKTALQTVNTVSLRKKPEQNSSAICSLPSLQQPEMANVEQYVTTAVNSNNALEPESLAEHVDSSIALTILSDQSSQPLLQKTPDYSNYELNLQLYGRAPKPVPENVKLARNTPLPKNLDTVTPSTNYHVISSKTTQRNEVSPDALTLRPDNKGQVVDARQGSNMTSSQIVIDLTEDDEQCINNQSRKRDMQIVPAKNPDGHCSIPVGSLLWGTESQIQTAVITTDAQQSITQSANEIDVYSVQTSRVSEAQPAKTQISTTTVQLSQTEIVQIFSIGGSMRGNNVMTENLKQVDPKTDQQPQHSQVPIQSVHPVPLPETPTSSDLPSEADNTSPPQKPELNLAQVKKPKGIALSWNVTDVGQTCAPVHCYQLYAYHEDPSLKCPSQWKIIGEIKALPLPMACTLTQFVLGSKYYFTVRAKDIYGRFGPFCEPQAICLLES
ncbi:activating transcription factor 7-interacting protein 1 [Heptranchias perlo]|uniref:activating transcription factor 7-interacting protein 1 n=1 Tax=Heptranchias perlo TaxID=212740 RepID=UPI00355A3553